MSNDVSRVYQFLATKGDWVSAADQDGDDKITKYEFRTYMYDNFDWENLEGWNGEESMKDDLVNSFWKTIDTNQGGKISGTKLKNKNALDDKEIASMENKIAIYEKLNEYTANLQAPSIISNTSGWKNSVVQGLAALVEKYTGSADDLEAYLDEHVTSIMNKTTADYFANDYISSEMADIVKEYGYAYADDETLQGMIDNYIQNIPEGSDEYDIKGTVTSIIDAYMATAGLKEDNAFDISTYGYNVTDTSPLNDLQKTIVEKNLQNNLEAIKNEADYADNSAAYDAAVTNYIESVLSEATFQDFNTIKSYGINEFKASDFYKNAKASFELKNILNCEEGSELYNAIKEALGETIANALTDGVYLTDSYLPIVNDVTDRVLKNGEFVKNGTLDKEALIQYVVEQVSANLSGILSESGAAKNLSLTELDTMFNKLCEQADSLKYSDTEKSLTIYREAAIQYCEAVAAKGSEYKAAVKEVVGSDYASVINSIKTPTEIKDLISQLKAKASEIVVKVDVTDKSDEIINNINNNLKYNGTSASTARATLTFRVTNTGEINFVVYAEKRGPWDDPSNTELNDFFNNKVRNTIENSYSSEIASLNLTQLEKDNLFNTALFVTLSDTTVLLSQYNETNLAPIVEKLVENYTKMLDSISNSDTAREYIKNQSSKSLLNGMTTYTEKGYTYSSDATRNLNKYYQDDKTNGGDDWVSIASRGTDSFSYGGFSGSIIILTGSTRGDNDPVNNAMKSILQDYINSYQTYIDGNRIIELFRQAQETAFSNLDATMHISQASGSSIYGYGETSGGKRDNSDTYSGKHYGVNSILINVIYEFEKLLSREICGL